MTVQSRTFNQFYNLINPLYPKLEESHFQEIYSCFCKAAQKITDKELVCFNRSYDRKIKRTIFVAPGQKKLYVTLKTKDINWINRNLFLIQSHEKLKKTFGHLSIIGLKTNKFSKKHFKPMLCFDFLNSSNFFSLVAKVSRIVRTAKKLKDSDFEFIDDEMFQRKQYNKVEEVPKLYHSHYYVGKISKIDEIKHLEISELMHRDLFNVISNPKSKLSKLDKLNILYQVAKILKKLHLDQTVHGDVKIDNIFISFLEDQLIIKLGDFENYHDWCNMNDFGGTISYWAPELYHHHIKEESQKINIQCPSALDIWSLGWVIYQLQYVNEPKWSKDINKIIKKYKVWDKLLSHDPENKRVSARKNLDNAYAEYRSNLEKHLMDQDEPSKDDIMNYLLWRCWKLNPEERITASEIVDLLEPFRV